MATLSLKDLQLYIIPGLGVDPQFAEIYEQTYDTWKRVWKDAFRELDGVDTLFSDGFTRHNKIIAIFHKKKCASLIAIRECDLSLAANKEDSLLSAWDEDAFSKLLVDGSKVGICTYLSVAPDYRGEIAPQKFFKDIIMASAVKALLDSEYDVMTGTMRRNRGTHKSAYASGATFIKQSSMHNIDVDLVGFFRRQIDRDQILADDLWLNSLWNNRIDLISAPNLKKLKTA